MPKWQKMGFWHHCAQNSGNKLWEMSENVTNELSWYENAVLGTKMSILAQLDWIIG